MRIDKMHSCYDNIIEELFFTNDIYCSTKYLEYWIVFDEFACEVLN